MKNPTSVVREVAYFHHLTSKKLWSLFIHVIISLNPFWVQLIYFIFLSLVGYFSLKITEPKTTSFRPKDIDVLFTAISAVTVSSMSTLDMEVFSNTQLIILLFLMFLGGEVLVSMLGLQFRKFKNRIASSSSSSIIHSVNPSIELGLSLNDIQHSYIDQDLLKYNALKSLGYVVFCYIMVVHFIGSIMIYIYISNTSSSRNILVKKGLNKQTFALFTTVSTFANCGFVPTNENMIIFRKNAGLLLIVIPQSLLGNTLYPVALRALILILEKITKRVEFNYILKNYKEMGYGQLLSRMHCCYLGMTVLGLILVEFVVFGCLEWDNVEVMGGLSGYEKVVGSLFQVVNTRYAGEGVFDLSKISPAILVSFVLLMYLPTFTTFLPDEDHEKMSRGDEKTQKRDQKKSCVEYILFSQLTYLVIFVFFISLTERKKINDDPLNFSLLNIVFEVFSAYGNVGFSTGYSCARRINHEEYCKDEWYGLAGRWSKNGKLMLILVMFMGRLKNFNKNGGRFWNVS